MAMMFGNRQNNQRDGKTDVNTRGIQLMNSEGYEPSTISIGSWNEMLSLRINPALEPSKRTEGRMYDYDRSVSTSLNTENVMLLLINIKEKILPAIKNEEEASIGLPINNGSSMVVVSTGKKLTNDIRPFIAIYKNLNADTRTPEMGMMYEFKTNRAIENYDEKTGDYTMSEVIHVELLLLIKMLESYIMNVGKFGVHYHRLVNKYMNDRTQNTLNAIADKVGAPINLAEGNKYPQRKNIFGNNGNNYNNHSDDAEQETLNDISELSNMLDQ